MQEVDLLERFRPLIRRIVKATCSSSPVIDIDDLVQEACLAVVKAAKQHDASCGASFRSYITTAIRRAIYEEASHFCGPFTLGHGTMSMAAKANRLHLSGVRISDVAFRMNIDIDDVKNLLDLYRGEQISFRESVFV